MSMSTLPLGTLLYRYFFFGWLFKDVGRGDLYQRASNWRHNKQQARWLTTYLRRWLFMTFLTYGLGAVCEMLLQAQMLSVVFFVPMAVSVSVNTVIGALMLGFKALPGPL
jgi:hypothetical protein